MKKAIWLFAGFILGVAVTLTVQYVCLCFRVPVRIIPPTAYIAPQSVSLDIGKMILVKSKEGSALINFTSHGEYGSESTYRWRFRSQTGDETKGEGRVKENGGTCSPIAVGSAKLLWSWGSKENCWLYYFDQDATVQLLPDKTFDTEELKL